MLRKTIIIRQEYIKPQLVFEEIEQGTGLMEGPSVGDSNAQEDNDSEGGWSKEATFIFDDDDNSVEMDLDY